MNANCNGRCAWKYEHEFRIDTHHLWNWALGIPGLIIRMYGTSHNLLQTCTPSNLALMRDEWYKCKISSDSPLSYVKVTSSSENGHFVIDQAAYYINDDQERWYGVQDGGAFCQGTRTGCCLEFDLNIDHTVYLC